MSDISIVGLFDAQNNSAKKNKVFRTTPSNGRDYNVSLTGESVVCFNIRISMCWYNITY